MAARRISKTVVDWAALAEKVPGKQKNAFRILKADTDKYIAKVSELPESLPEIDFASYTKRVSNAALVTEFEKLYKALEIPYPKDTANSLASLKALEKAEMQKKDAFIAENQTRCKQLQEVLDAMDSVPPPDKMTLQMFNHYFPEIALNPNRENPGFYPQDNPRFQIDKMDQYINTRYDRKNIYLKEDIEEELRMEWEEQKAEKAKQIAAEEKAAKKLGSK